MIERSVGWDQRMPVSEVPFGGQHTSPRLPTSWVEQALIFVTVVLIPLQNNIPPVAGMSASFLLFGALAAYTVVSRPRVLGQIWLHPSFFAAYVFIGVSAFLEFSSPLSNYGGITRFAQMIGGAVCLAVLCRDRLALTVGLYGYIAAALWVSLYLFLTSYGAIQQMGGTANFQEATNVRESAFADSGLETNINSLAFTCTQGAVVAFAMAVVGSSRRFLLLGIAIFCLIAAFLPMSRGAAVISLVSFASILHACGTKHGTAIVFVAILSLGIYAIVPDAVWSRMAFSTDQSEDGKMEGRARIYTRALNRLPEYVVSGVGAGNYHNKWGFEKGFSKEHNGVAVVYGAHNSLFQITIYWGILGLLMFLLIVWNVYRSIPLQCARDELALALVGILVSLSLWLLTTHGFYEKSFACGLGLFVGARKWIWPTGVVSAVEGSRTSSPR
ncbi:MAG: O-antigen ligase family protein [Nitrospira sp.]|nr:O-antigen ligase family protein [Nitrospira sp.]